MSDQNQIAPNPGTEPASGEGAPAESTPQSGEHPVASAPSRNLTEGDPPAQRSESAPASGAVPASEETAPASPGVTPAAQEATAGSGSPTGAHAATGNHSQPEASASAGTNTAGRRRPFRGVPAADYVRDGAAALLLLLSLGLPWDMFRDAASRVDVLLVTLLSLLSLTLPYLARAGAMPAGWTVQATRRTRILANAPYVIVVVVYIVLDAAQVDGVSLIGSAVALGLAGALLAAQPRQCELGPADTDARSTSGWLMALIATGAVVIVTVLIAMIWGVIQVDGAELVLLVIVQGLFVLALVALPVLGIAMRQEGPRLALVALGASIVVAILLGGASQGGPLVADSAMGTDRLNTLNSLGQFMVARLGFGESLRAGVFGIMLIPALAALASSAPVARAMASVSPVSRWRGAATSAFDLAAVTAAGVALWNIVTVAMGSGWGATEVVEHVLVILFALICLGASILGRMVATRPNSTRAQVVTWAIILIVFGLAAGVLTRYYDQIVGIRTSLDPNTVMLSKLLPAAGLEIEPFLMGVGLPVFIICALTIPRALRTGETAAGHAHERAWVWSPPAPKPVPATGGYGQPTGNQGQPGGYQGQPGGYQGQPGTYPAQAPTGPMPGSSPAGQYAAGPYPASTASSAQTQSFGFTEEQARDPRTPMAVLAQIAQDAPHLRAAVAANPNTYPALLEWLGNLGDPAVNAALAARRQP